MARPSSALLTSSELGVSIVSTVRDEAVNAVRLASRPKIKKWISIPYNIYSSSTHDGDYVRDYLGGMNSA